MATTKRKITQSGNSTDKLTALLVDAPRRVGDLMTSQVVTLRPHDRFQLAVDLLAKNHFRHLPVAEIDGKLTGVISDRDVLRCESGYDSATTLVADIMTLEPISVSADMLISEAVSLTLDYRVNCLPVVDDGQKICGIITTTDLMHALQKLQLTVESLAEGA